MTILARAAAVLGVWMALGASASGDAWVDRANQRVGLVPGNKAIEATLFPKVASMDQFPGKDEVGEGAAFFILEGCKYLEPDGASEWTELAAWAQAPAQVAVIEALEAIGDPKSKWMFALPFGRENVEASWATRDLCIDLGRDGMLAGARYSYFNPIGEMHLLVTVEANRLLEAGKGDEGLERYLDLLWFYRYMADRESVMEKQTAMELMMQTCEQMRDLAWRGLHSKQMTGKGIGKVVAAMEEREIYLMRIRPPALVRLVVEQLVEETLGGAGGADGFAVAMARSTSGERPLMLFNESAKWRDAANGHAGAIETIKQLDVVLGDYATRWTFDWWDALLDLPTDYQKMDHQRFAAVAALAGDVGPLLALRQQLVVELSGTRCALGGAGYQLDFEKPAGELVRLQPAYVPSLKQNLDAYKYNEWEKKLDELLYFVPGTGQRVDVAGRPGVHEIAMGAFSGAISEVTGMVDRFPFLQQFGEAPGEWGAVPF